MMPPQDYGHTKYGADGLLASSAEAGWQGIGAEHRHHARGELPSFQPLRMEIGIATASHRDCIVSRTGDRLRQHTRVKPGTIWLCPVGVLEEDIVISQWHEVLHLYVPTERFAQLSDARGGAAARPESVCYVGGIYHDRIRRLGIELIRHLQAPGAGGAVLTDVLSLELTACIVDNYSGDSRRQADGDGERRLDRRRLRRVLEYMTEHLEQNICLDDLAGAACLSMFHFIRLFSNTMGQTPHRYLSSLRLERAKTMLSLRTAPISEVALSCGFSTQSNFTKAFRRATGFSPRVYRNLWATGIGNRG
ncbi:MAG: AraC family transcriptional regulator [Dokdonella sp.]